MSLEQIVVVHGVVTWWSVVMSSEQIVGVHGVVTWLGFETEAVWADGNHDV